MSLVRGKAGAITFGLVGYLFFVELVSGILQGFYVPLIPDLVEHLGIRDADFNWFEASQLLLSAIVRQYRLLIQVKTLLGQGVVGAEQIAAEIGEKKSTFPVEKAQKLVGLYTFAQLDAIMDRLLETDMAMKTGDDQDTVLDVLVADLTNRTPQPAHASVAPVAHSFS